MMSLLARQTEMRMAEHLDLDVLRQLKSLSAASEAAISWLAEHVAPRSFEPGDELIVQGDSSRECFFIVHGETEVARDGTVLGISGAGEPEGELGLFLRTPRSATTTARTTVSTLVLRPDDWDELVEAQPPLAEEIRVVMCRHLAERLGLPSFAGVERAP
jgi:CRP-like cAMP-binding protein